MRPAMGVILLILGMASLLSLPVLAVILIGVGGWLLLNSTRAEQADAEGVFFGIALLCMIILAIAGLFF